MAGYIQANDSTDFNFGWNDFTIEFFLEPNTNSNSQVLFEISDTANSCSLSLNNGILNLNGIGSTIVGGLVSTGNLHYVSVERSSNVIYLFLDGVCQYSPTSRIVAIPNNNGNPVSLTIGADISGNNCFDGEFGDFKINNGFARHIRAGSNISSNFTNANLGNGVADIVVTGGEFIGKISSYSPEELVTSQIFDTLQISVSQIAIGASNTSTPIIGYEMFKPMILAGPVGSYTIDAIGNAMAIFPVPWTTLLAGDAAITANGISVPSNEWQITNGRLNIPAHVGANIVITPTGPTTYSVLSSNCYTTLSSPLYANSTSINLSNGAGFPSPTIGKKGTLFIEGECINYVYISGNTLSGLTRGVSGTGILPLYNSNTQVICSGTKYDIKTLSGIEPSEYLWYTANSGTSLQNTHSTISNILVNYGSFKLN
jgi:hypothetical protein